MMRIQIVVFMVLAIQVCPIFCVDLDAILSAVEEEQQATHTMSPPPGTDKAAPLNVPLILELPKLSLEKASAADCRGPHSLFIYILGACLLLRIKICNF